MELVLKLAIQRGISSYEVFLLAHEKYEPHIPKWRVVARYERFKKTGRAPDCVVKYVLGEAK